MRWSLHFHKIMQKWGNVDTANDAIPGSRVGDGIFRNYPIISTFSNSWKFNEDVRIISDSKRFSQVFCFLQKRTYDLLDVELISSDPDFEEIQNYKLLDNHNQLKPFFSDSDSYYDNIKRLLDSLDIHNQLKTFFSDSYGDDIKKLLDSLEYSGVLEDSINIDYS